LKWKWRCWRALLRLHFSYIHTFCDVFSSEPAQQMVCIYYHVVCGPALPTPVPRAREPVRTDKYIHSFKLLMLQHWALVRIVGHHADHVAYPGDGVCPKCTVCRFWVRPAFTTPSLTFLYEEAHDVLESPLPEDSVQATTPTHPSFHFLPPPLFSKPSHPS